MAKVDSSSSSTTAIFRRPNSLDTIPPGGRRSVSSCGAFALLFSSPPSRSVRREWRMISRSALRSSGGASLPLSATSMASSSDAARSRRSRRRASIAVSSDASACRSLSFAGGSDDDESCASNLESLDAQLACSLARTATADSMSDLSDAADAASSSPSLLVPTSPASIRAMACTAR